MPQEAMGAFSSGHSLLFLVFLSLGQNRQQKTPLPGCLLRSAQNLTCAFLPPIPAATPLPSLVAFVKYSKQAALTNKVVESIQLPTLLWFEGSHMARGVQEN